MQEAAGLQTMSARYSDYQPELITYGKVLNPVPLIEFRKQYQITAAQYTAAREQFNISQKKLSRLKNLHQNKAISTRKLQQQLSQWQTDKSRLNQIVIQLEMLKSINRLQWGEKLTGWFTGTTDTAIEKILTRKEQLLQIVMPYPLKQQDTINTIQVSARGDRNRTYSARFVSLSPKVDPFSQGQQFFFLSSNPELQIGMNITAWVSQPTMNRRGMLIPRSALIWHLNQSFVYIKTDDETFIHRNIDHLIKVSDGYFIGTAIRENEEFVSQGAQMLLSHEFRSQIPDEDDND